jgi:hypothetical protein
MAAIREVENADLRPMGTILWTQHPSIDRRIEPRDTSPGIGQVSNDEAGFDSARLCAASPQHFEFIDPLFLARDLRTSDSEEG